MGSLWQVSRESHLGRALHIQLALIDKITILQEGEDTNSYLKKQIKPLMGSRGQESGPQVGRRQVSKTERELGGTNSARPGGRNGEATRGVRHLLNLASSRLKQH